MIENAAGDGGGIGATVRDGDFWHGAERLFGDLEAEFGSTDPPVAVLQFDPELVLAGRDLGSRDRNAVR
jgi:hypothetical protein